MDLATVVGLIVSFALIGIVMVMSGSLMMYWDFMSILIVIFGSALSVLMRCNLAGFIEGLLAGLNAFFNKVESPEELVDVILHLSGVARKGSILALDKENIENAYMNKGIQLTIDGTDPAIIEEILDDDMKVTKSRQLAAVKIYEDLGEAAPAFGMIGTVIGLIVIMANLNDPSKIGPGLAVALITTLYGAIVANAVYIPIAAKLKLRANEEARNCQIIKIGVLSIMNGLNPNIIRNRLKTYLADGSEPSE